MYGVTEDTVARDDLEYYHLTPKQRLEQTKKIMNFTGVKEIYILNIDHRLEYYLYVDETIFSHGDFLRYLADYTSKPLDEVILETSAKFNEDVIRQVYELLGGFLEYSFDEHTIYIYIAKELCHEKTLLFCTEILRHLFKSAFEFASKTKLDPKLHDLMRESVSQAIAQLCDHYDSFADKQLVFIGKNKELLEVDILFNHVDYGSLTLVTPNYPMRKALEKDMQLSQQTDVPMQKNLHVVDSTQMAYFLAQADVVVILTGFNEAHGLGTEELLAVGQTPKKQYVLDSENTQLGDILLSKTGSEKLPLKNQTEVPFAEKEAARNYLDEQLDLLVEQQMNELLMG